MSLPPKQQRLIDWLTGKHEFHLIGPDTDLRIYVTGRTWINADGRKNFPMARSSRGRSNRAPKVYPLHHAGLTHGRSVEDIRLKFEMARWSTPRPQERGFPAEAARHRRRRPLFGRIRLWHPFRHSEIYPPILFDEKIGGTVHMAVGAGIPKPAIPTSPRSTGT